MVVKYPQGELCDTDEGELSFCVGIIDEKVVVDFGKPVAWIGMDWETATGLAETLLVRAHQIARRGGENEEEAE